MSPIVQQIRAPSEAELRHSRIAEQGAHNGAFGRLGFFGAGRFSRTSHLKKVRMGAKHWAWVRNVNGAPSHRRPAMIDEMALTALLQDRLGDVARLTDPALGAPPNERGQRGAPI